MLVYECLIYIKMEQYQRCVEEALITLLPAVRAAASTINPRKQPVDTASPVAEPCSTASSDVDDDLAASMPLPPLLAQVSE